MASRQEKEERAETEARQAVQDLSDANKQREYEERTKMGTDDYQAQQQPGVFGSMFKKVADTYEHAKEAVVGKSQETAEKTKETAYTAADKAKENKDYTTEKAKETTDTAARKLQDTKEATKEKLGEYKDRTAEKAEDYKNYAGEKAKETKDYTGEKANEAAEKAKETKDYSAEKAKEGKDVTTSKLGEITESAKGAARKAMDLFSGKKEEAKEKTIDTKEATKEKLSEAEEEARQKMEELKMEGKEHKEDKDIEAQRGTRGGETIYGNVGLGSITDSIKGKLTQPHEIVKETRAAREHGGTGRKDLDEGGVEEEAEVMGTVAAALKAADQMSGQTFNDVGRIGDEGVYRIKLHREEKK